MNNIYTNLIDSITDELKVFNLNEDVQFSLSKIDEYDLQINNLVKYNKEKFFSTLQEKIVEIIKESQIFETVDKNDIGFINLSLNHRFLMNKITNSKNDFINKIRNYKGDHIEYTEEENDSNKKIYNCDLKLPETV